MANKELQEYTNKVFKALMKGPSLREIEHSILLSKIEELKARGVLRATNK